MDNYIHKDAFYSLDMPKHWTITASGGAVITNADIEAGSIEITERLCSEQDLTFTAEASSFRVVIRNIFTELVGQTLTVDVQLGDLLPAFRMGTYKVYTDEPTADRTKREVKAYDVLYEVINSDVASWYNGLTFPLTIAQYRASFFNHFGITEQAATLVNDTETVEKTIAPTTLSGRDVLDHILQANGVFGHIMRDNTFKYIELEEIIEGLYPRNDLYPENTLYPADASGVTPLSTSHYKTAKYEKYIIERIDKLIIREAGGDVGQTIGSGSNAYIIEGNELFFGKSAADLTRMGTKIYTNAHKIWYRPCTIEAQGNPCFEVGDGVRAWTKYDLVYGYILTRTIKGTGALSDTYSCGGKKERSKSLNSASSQFEQLRSKTLKVEQSVDQVSTELTEQLDDTVQGSYAYQTAQEIGLKVSKSNIVTDLDNAMSSSITITPSNINIASSGALTIFTSQFTLAANGNATFGGNVTGATISGGTISNTPYVYESNGDRTQIGATGLTTSEGSKFSSVAPGGITVSNGSQSCAITPSGATYALSAGSASIAYQVASTDVHPTLTAAGNVDLYGSTNAATPTWCANTFEPLSSSDRRLKENIAEVTENDIKILERLKVYFFTYKGKESDKLLHCGVMAQDVLAVMGELGIDIDKQSIVEEYETRSYMDEHEICGEKAYRVNYKELSNLLIFAWQRDHERLNSLEDRLNRLEMKNNE